MQRHEPRHVELGEVDDPGAGRLAVGDLVDPSGGPMDAGALVAFPRAAPVEHEDAAVEAVAEVDAAEPGVAREEPVGFVPADVTAPRAFEPLDVHAAAVEVEREELAAILGRPLVAEID